MYLKYQNNSNLSQLLCQNTFQVRQYLLITANVLYNENLSLSSISTWRFCKCYDECKATPSIRVGYAYDYNTSSLGEFNSGTHEIFVLFNLDLSSRG
jgi:hypothetical protein